MIYISSQEFVQLFAYHNQYKLILCLNMHGCFSLPSGIILNIMREGKLNVFIYIAMLSANMTHERNIPLISFVFFYR